MRFPQVGLKREELPLGNQTGLSPNMRQMTTMTTAIHNTGVYRMEGAYLRPWRLLEGT